MSIQTPQAVPQSFTKLAEVFAEGLARGLGRFQVPESPTSIVDPNAVVSEYFDAAHQVLEANRTYAKSLASVASNFQLALRQQTASSVEALRGQVGGVVENTVTQIEEQSAVLQEVQEEVREDAEAAAEAAEEQERAEVRNRYEDLRKPELVEELGRRGLLKTGTVDELVDRLVEDDLK